MDASAFASITKALGKKTLSSLLGPPSVSASSSDVTGSDPARNQDAGISANRDLIREERQAVNTEWLEAHAERAGVGLNPANEALQHDSKSSMPLTLGSGNLADSDVLHRQMLGPSINVKSNGRASQLNGAVKTVLGKRDHRSMTSGRRNDDGHSSEDEGRSALGKLRSGAPSKIAGKPKKPVTVIETFESMQKSSQEAEVKSKDVGNGEEVGDASDQSEVKKSHSRPKSYMDELLEAKQIKQRRKRRRKENAKA